MLRRQDVMSEVIHNKVQNFQNLVDDLKGRRLRSVAHARCSVG